MIDLATGILPHENSEMAKRIERIIDAVRSDGSFGSERVRSLINKEINAAIEERILTLLLENKMLRDTIDEVQLENIRLKDEIAQLKAERTNA